MARLNVNLHGEEDRGVFIDGHNINRVMSISFNVDINTVPTATMEVIGCDNFEADISALEVVHRIIPDSIENCAIVLIEAIKRDSVIREGFIASIASALKECEMPFADERYAAEKVLKRIIGED